MKRILLSICFLFFIGVSSFSQSKIEKAEKSLKKKEKTTENTKSNHNNSRNNHNSEGDFLTEVVGEIIVQAFAYSIYAVAIESPFEMENKASNAYITKHPYYKSNKGNYIYDWSEDITFFRTDLSTRYISENSKLKGMHLNLEMHFLKRIAIEGDYLQLWENNPNFGYDNLAIYTSLAKYYRVRSEKFDAWWGLGASYIDGSVNEFGFTYGLGAEWFIAKPISAEVSYNQTLINDESINKFNGLLNYHFKQFKIIGGYEHLRIGNQNFSTVTLGTGFFF
ncbi:outer membrane beta-barrel protein [Litoribaculum gwangyangense]|uniref:Outer membrane protein beta-barrel domain-containing protein n=1 Tax=Litoribaculum gwangyangense TaxID=1130722 RepID=A0ABP9C779_9FLAO